MDFLYGVAEALVFEYGSGDEAAARVPTSFDYGATDEGFFDYGGASGGDDGGDGSGGKVRRSAKRKPKPKFVVEVDGKFVVVDSQAEADQVIRPKTEVPIIDPPETLAEDISEDEQQAALIKAQNDAKVMEMIEQMQRDDEDDVEMLLLSL